MAREDKSIEIVNEIKEDTKTVQKESTTKKVFAWIIMVVAIIYEILPIDIIPDAPVVGLIDDFIIGIAAFINLIQQEFFQTNNILNKILNIAKWILISLVIWMFLMLMLVMLFVVK